MEEQEKIDIREHLIGWIDTFLEDGIVPQVVNPKAIRTNYIPKSKMQREMEKLDNMTKEIINGKLQKYTVGEIIFLKEFLRELLGDEE